jgi:acyl-coenzyme A thioesterase PaaI-like protein
VGDRITAKTSIIKVGKSIGNFLIEAYNQDDKKVAIMKGMVFYLGDRWA